MQSTFSIMTGLDLPVLTSPAQSRPIVSEIKKNELENLSYVDPRLILLDEVKLKNEIKRPGTLIFIHPPKTGGTGCDKFFKALNLLGIEARKSEDYFLPEAKHFPRTIRCTIPDTKENTSPNLIYPGWIGGIQTAIDEDFKENLSFYKDYDVITGHMPYGLHHYPAAKFNEPLGYCTIINDPVKRELSSLNFDYQRGYLEGLNESEILDYLLNANIDNAQTRMLAGTEYMSGICDEKTLEAAKSNIEKHFLVAGVTDDVESFLKAMAAIYKIVPMAIGREQVTGKKIITQLPDEIIKKLENKNSFDKKLYEWVKKRWYEFKDKNILSNNSIEKFKSKDDDIQRYLTIFADKLKEQKPNLMSKQDITHYNNTITRTLETLPVNVDHFSSKQIFENMEKNTSSVLTRSVHVLKP